MTDIFGPGVAASQQTNFCHDDMSQAERAAAYLSVLMTVQLLLPVWTWNWLVSAYWRGTPSLSHSTSGGSSSSPPLPFREHCIFTGLPRDEMTVVGLRSNSKSLIKRGKITVNFFQVNFANHFPKTTTTTDVTAALLYIKMMLEFHKANLGNNIFCGLGHSNKYIYSLFLPKDNNKKAITSSHSSRWHHQIVCFV